MTPFDKIIEKLADFNFGEFSFDWIFKVILITGMVFYIAFGIIVVRQVDLMSRTLNGSFNWSIKILAWIHLGMILGLFLIILLSF